MNNLLINNDLILMEGSVVERLRRMKGIELHPKLENAPLIYDNLGRIHLTEIYNSYMDIAIDAQLPFMMCTPTWRTNRERVSETRIGSKINQDVAQFMIDLKDTRPQLKDKIKIGGMIGCKNDCYKPEEGLSTSEAESFHSWQIEELADGGVDFMSAQTLPYLPEAKGIARALEKVGIPYIISFVISRNGNLLDGTSLQDAIHIIDNEVQTQPLGYAVNCAYPTFLCADSQPKEAMERMIGYFGNASSLDHCDLDGSDALHIDSISDWGTEMLKLNKSHGIKILGGCCGTNVEHLRYITDNYKKS